MRNTLTLFRNQLKGDLGISEGLHSPDPRKVKKAVGVIFLYIVLALVFLVIFGCLSLTFVSMGLADMVPALLALAASVMIFIFNVFRTGASMFSMRRFEMEAALPVTSAELVAGKFLSLYVVNLGLTAVITVPGLIICGLAAPVSALYIVFSIIGVLLLPLIPLSLAVAVSTGIYAVAARLRFRKIIGTVLGLLLMVGLFIVMFSFNMSASSADRSGALDGMAVLIADNFEAVTAWYIPGGFLSSGIHGDLISMLLYILLSCAVAAAVFALVSWKYRNICQALEAKDARKEYVMTSQKNSSVGRSLFKRDFKRYISSTTYVTNTLFGDILMVIMSCIAVFGSSNLFGEEGGFRILFVLLPLALSLAAGMSSTTPSSLSMEGKSWWILQTLPVTPKDIFKSKIRLNLVIALPFYLISVLIIAIGKQPNIAELAALILLPAAYIFFISVFGMNMAIKHSNFSWSSETEAVKQGLSIMYSVLISFGTLLASLFLAMMVYFTAASTAGPSGLSEAAQIAADYGPCLMLCVIAVIFGIIGFALRAKVYRKQFRDIIE